LPRAGADVGAAVAVGVDDLLEVADARTVADGFGGDVAGVGKAAAGCGTTGSFAEAVDDAASSAR
jgi:hypothetical protein